MALRTKWRDSSGHWVSPDKLDGRKSYTKELYDGRTFVRSTPHQRWGKVDVRAGLESIAPVPVPTADPSRFDTTDTTQKQIDPERSVTIQIGNAVKKAPDGDAFGLRIMHGGNAIKYQVIEDMPKQAIEAQLRGMMFATAREVAAARGDEIPRAAGSEPLIEVMAEFSIEIDTLDDA
jgi:hypothetical protein